MSECCIIGAGSTKYNALPNRHNFYISANLHYPNANIIFAQDDPILDKLLKKRTDGFLRQPVFTTPQKYRDYKDFDRCYVFDYRKFFKVKVQNTASPRVSWRSPKYRSLELRHE